MNLVTGATGIVGSHVVMALMLKQLPVKACKQKTSDLSKIRKLFADQGHPKDFFESIEWIELDLLDIFQVEEALEGITNVYHCAGYVSFDSRDRRKLRLLNEQATKNLVNACLHKNTSFFCHVSSLATLHNLDYRAALDERVFWKKSGKESDYAISKYNAEREVWRGMEEGLKAVIVNPGVVLAAGFWKQSSSRIFETCYNGNRFYTTGTTGYISAKDAANIMLILTQQQITGERFILVEDNYTFYEIFRMINSFFGKKPPAIKVGRTILQLASFWEAIVTFFVKREKQVTPALVNSALNRQLYSNVKVKQRLKYTFEPTQQVLQHICKMYQKEHPKA